MNGYFIKIKGTQGIDKDTETVEFSTFGDMQITENSVILTYSEGEMLGVKNVNTKLTAKGEKSVIMERTGDMNSKLLIEKGVRNGCFYSTPQGDLEIGIYGKQIKNMLNESGGTLFMSYSIDSNLQPISVNTVEIEVKKAK